MLPTRTIIRKCNAFYAPIDKATEAGEYGDVLALKYFCDKYNLYNDRWFLNKGYAHVKACEYGHLRILIWMLKNNMILLDRNDCGSLSSCIMWAGRHGSLDIIKYLVNCGGVPEKYGLDVITNHINYPVYKYMLCNFEYPSYDDLLKQVLNTIRECKTTYHDRIYKDVATILPKKIVWDRNFKSLAHAYIFRDAYKIVRFMWRFTPIKDKDSIRQMCIDDKSLIKIFF